MRTKIRIMLVLGLFCSLLNSGYVVCNNNIDNTYLVQEEDKIELRPRSIEVKVDI